MHDQKKHKKHKYHIMSPYVFTLSMGMIILSTVMVIIYIIMCFLEAYNPNGPDECWKFIAFLEILLYLTVILDGHELIAYFKIEENQLALYSPGLKTWRLDLTTCTDIGIDYGTISGGIKQYWFYFSVGHVPKKYFHRINRLKYSKTCIRIAYSDEHYNTILENTSGTVRRKLKNAHSVIENAKRKGEEF